MELITAKEAVKQLKQEAGVVISQQRFGRLKQIGAFKVHRKHNSRRDWFILNEVLEGYFNYVSPRTDQQHRVRAEYYGQGESPDTMLRELTKNDIKIEEFEVPGHVAKQFKDELIHINSANWLLRDFADDVLQIIEPIHHPSIKVAYEKAYYNKDIAQGTLDMLIEDYEENTAADHTRHLQQ